MTTLFPFDHSPLYEPTILGIAVIAVLAPQVVLVWTFARTVRQRLAATRLADAAGRREAAKQVPAEVVLCLRGADEGLEDVFASLAAQQHAAWRLQVVVDSRDDPAWEIAERSITAAEEAGTASWSAATLEPLAQRPQAGSLKCASLRQAIGRLAESTEVVALLDADTRPPAEWLATLVEAVRRPGVGAVSGNRWYEPAVVTPAAMVRALWNAGAVVQMTAFGIPWGGSLAIRREAIVESRLAEVIEHTLCEDTALAEPLRRAGWKYRFEPAIFSIQHDGDLALVSLTRWIARQLLTARLHHPAWPLVLTHAVSSSLVLIACLAAALAAAIDGAGVEASANLGLFAGYEIVSLLMALAIRRSVLSAVPTERLPAHVGTATAPAWLGWIPLTQLVYATAALMAVAARSVEWRGIRYRIGRGAVFPIEEPTLLPTPKPVSAGR